MISPVKLYKVDKYLARTPNPAGKAICTRHYNVDWTVHRLLPAAVSRRSSLTQKGIGRVVAPISQRTENGRRTAAPERFREDAARVFADSSPRWGERGEAPAGAATVPFPPKGSVEISDKLVFAAGSAAGGTTAYKSHNKLQSIFNKGIKNSSHPKYKSKVKKGTYTQYKY